MKLNLPYRSQYEFHQEVQSHNLFALVCTQPSHYSHLMRSTDYVQHFLKLKFQEKNKRTQGREEHIKFMKYKILLLIFLCKIILPSLS